MRNSLMSVAVLGFLAGCSGTADKPTPTAPANAAAADAATGGAAPDSGKAMAVATAVVKIEGMT